jgi:CRISPR system Cascade subunit CasA
MNLASDDWIPVVDASGKAGRVSLRGVFEQGDGLADLNVRADERVALMRLLIAVAQAALNGPADWKDWNHCKERLAGAAAYYLQRWQAGFELLAQGPRFLQLQGLVAARGADEEGGGTLVSKLDFALSTGNNDTLFDNAGGELRTMTEEELALRLLTFQCYSPSGRIGVVKWNGEASPGNGSSAHAPCLTGSMVHAYVRGKNLLETIHRNLLHKELVDRIYGRGRWGQPIWERIPKSFSDKEAIRNATETYLGRLVPLSRAIWIESDRLHIVLGNGLDYPGFGEKGGPREAAATVVVVTNNGKREHRVLGLSLDRAIWRELHSVAVKRHSAEGAGGPLALENLDDSAAVDLWTGGLAADRAKPLDVVESVFHLPAGMLCETGTKIYEEGVRRAERVAQALEAAIIDYAGGVGNGGGQSPRAAPVSVRTAVLSRFWSAAEQSVGDLLEAAGNPGKIAQDGWEGTAWARVLKSAALEALGLACPRSTARQVRAYVRAETELRKRISSLFRQ